MPDPQETDTANASSRPPLLLSVLGLVAAFGLALWAGMHYMTHNASLLYGLVAGLSFGAAFAFGQQIKNRIVPPKKRKTDWKVQSPGAADLSPAKLAAQQARRISVQCDDQEIRTLVRGKQRESIAWDQVIDVSIRISTGTLPQPEWIIAGQDGSAIRNVRVPNDADGLDTLIEAMKQRLPGYDNDQTYDTVIAAMAAMEGDFHVWRRPFTPA